MVMFIDEEKMAQELVENFRLINLDTYKRLQAYIKYLKHQKNTKNDVRNKIDELMMDYYSGFVMADWDATLQSMVNKYTRPHYREYKKTNSIYIYEDELEFIKNIGSVGDVGSIEVEKVLFVMLILGKLSQCDKEDIWVNQKSVDTFKLARFKYKQKADQYKIQREKLIYDLGNYKDFKILEPTTFGNSPGIKILYSSKTKKKQIIKIGCMGDCLENVIVKYLNWRNIECYKYCERCGVKIIDTNNKTVRCKDCAKKLKNEKDKERIKTIRQNL